MATIFNTASTADITGVNVTGSHEVYFHRVDLSPETEFTGADLYVTLQYQTARTKFTGRRNQPSRCRHGRRIKRAGSPQQGSVHGSNHLTEAQAFKFAGSEGHSLCC